LWLEFVNKLFDDFGFREAHVRELILFSKFIDEIKDLLGMASDLVKVGLSVDVIEKFHFTALFALFWTVSVLFKLE